MLRRFVCIHGHFYQPPRENPWLEEIEQQDSAYPFHDWNERITAECYEPNRAARILDEEHRIRSIVSNYAQISFNFGPTLLSWLERCRPLTYQAILEADRASRDQFSGHGSAMAQAYNHMILPLANQRDLRTQVLWGIADFAHRFGRKPEGMWLPEMAVNTATLEALAESGIHFTLLAPHQAKRIRHSNRDHWREVVPGSLDLRRSYRCRLPSGRTIALFFYDGAIAHDVAFAGLLNNGEGFSTRLLDTFSGQADGELVHIATDGESYGHHHRFGEMALAYCLDQIRADPRTGLTIYAEHLAKHPPQWEVEIVENSSWSCAHGLERWRSDCGCRIGNNGWIQSWREPLRTALDWLRDRLETIFESELGTLLAAPWEARDDYIEIVLERTPERIEHFFKRHAGQELSSTERIKALSLLEMQRHAMLMYTSCGWFFDEVSGIETEQILAYAARALQLAERSSGQQLEETFLGHLARVPSNLARWGDAARIYREQIRPLQLDLPRVAAHHAITAQFGEPERNGTLYCYRTETLDYAEQRGGPMKLTLGRNRVTSTLTGETGEFSFAVLHFGAQHLSAGIRPDASAEAFASLSRSLNSAFAHSDLPTLVRLMDQHFPGGIYSFWHLFRDEQRRIVRSLIDRTIGDILQTFSSLYESQAGLLRFLRDIQMPLPQPLAVPVEQVVNDRLRRQLDDGEFNPLQFHALLRDAEEMGLNLDRQMLAFAASHKIERMISTVLHQIGDMNLLLQTRDIIAAIEKLPWEIDLWQAQNLFIELHRRSVAALDLPPDWNAELEQLGDCLQVKII